MFYDMTSQTMINNAGQDWTGSLSPTFQILINKVLRTSQTLTSKAVSRAHSKNNTHKQ